MDYDNEDDGFDPWERDEDAPLLNCPPEAHMEPFEPPVDEYMEEEPELHAQGEPITLGPPPAAAGPPADPEALAATAAVLPVVDLQYTTPERRERVEPTALTPAPMVAKLMPKAPKLQRLTKKTTVPEDVCPKVVLPFVDLTSEVFVHSEEYLSKQFFRRLDGQQQYNWVYERLRSFYVNKVHPRTLTKKGLLTFQLLSGVERQKEGRRAFRDLDSTRRAQVAAAWMKASAPPKYIAHVILEQFITPGGDCAARNKVKGVLLTWMLPADFAKVSKVVGSEEPTALAEVVRRLRASADVHSAWKDIQLHAQICLRLAGASDVAVCLEVCPETWEERGEVKLHVHAFLKSSGSDLRVRNMNPFEFSGVKPNASQTIGGMPVQGNGRSSWAVFLLLYLRQGGGRVQRGDKATLQRIFGAAELDSKPRAVEKIGDRCGKSSSRAVREREQAHQRAGAPRRSPGGRSSQEGAGGV